MAGRTQVGRWQPSDGQTTKTFSQLKAASRRTPLAVSDWRRNDSNDAVVRTGGANMAFPENRHIQVVGPTPYPRHA